MFIALMTKAVALGNWFSNLKVGHFRKCFISLVSL